MDQRITFVHDVRCDACGATYSVTPRPGAYHYAICGVCGNRDERLLTITERREG